MGTVKRLPKSDQMELIPAPTRSETSTVLSMIDKVLTNPEIPVERLQQLFDLHTRVSGEAARVAYYRDFAALQASLPPVERKGRGHNDKAYARFEDIMAKVRPHLAQHGFSIFFRTAQPDGKLSVTGVLAHRDGHSEETTLTLPSDNSGGKNAVQAWGSSTSYGKRYVLVTLLGIATADEDDDGSAAGTGETISEAQYKQVAALLAQSGTEINDFCAHYKIETLDDLPAKLADKAIGLLKIKIKKQGAST